MTLISSFFSKSKAVCVGLFLFLVLALKYFVSKSSRLEVHLENEKKKSRQMNAQADTYIDEEIKARKKVEDAKTDSFINRNHFE